ncbi:MAG: ArnT family glycosyltransferase [Anaerolineae bacterium]
MRVPLSMAVCLILFVFHVFYVPRHPLQLEVVGTPQEMEIRIDGVSHQVTLDRPLSRVRFPDKSPFLREYQIDGTDSTNNFTFDRSYIEGIHDSPYYRFVAFLRDEGGYSRWRNLVIREGLGHLRSIVPDPESYEGIELPPHFTLTVGLHRLEVPARVLLLAEDGRGYELTVDRNAHAVGLTRYSRGLASHQIARWYFPQEAAPFLALNLYTLTHLVFYALTLFGAVFLLGLALSLLPRPSLPDVHFAWPGAVAAVLIAASFLFTLYIAVIPYNGMPHILDSIAYYFQAKIFARGWLSAPSPPDIEVLGVPFVIDYKGHWFAKYPPGTSLLISLGMILKVPWLIGPLLGAGSLIGIYRIAIRLYDRRVAILAVLLGALSPFHSFITGTYLSHPVSLFFLVFFLLFLLRYQQDGGLWNIALSASFLGVAGLTRELSTALFAAPFLTYFLGYLVRREGWRVWRPLALFASILVVFGGLYLAYNLAQTGDPLAIPRLIADPTDRYGFGPNVGFYGRHTLAAGLMNMDQLLTVLMIDLYGWPFYFALAFPLLPFLTGRANRCDVLNGLGVLAILLGHVPYFYHGIAYGPRYYYAALPMLVVLTARGVVVSQEVVNDLIARLRGRRIPSGWAVYPVLGALIAPNLFFYLPRHLEIYADFTGIPWEKGLSAEAVYEHQPEGAVVITDNRWVYLNVLSVRNCPSLDCSTIYAFAEDENHLAVLRALYPDKQFFQIEWQDGRIFSEPLHPFSTGSW